MTTTTRSRHSHRKIARKKSNPAKAPSAFASASASPNLTSPKPSAAQADNEDRVLMSIFCPGHSLRESDAQQPSDSSPSASAIWSRERSSFGLFAPASPQSTLLDQAAEPVTKLHLHISSLLSELTTKSPVLPTLPFETPSDIYTSCIHAKVLLVNYDASSKTWWVGLTLERSGKLCWPVGKVDATDVSDEAAALREPSEETGFKNIDASQLSLPISSIREAPKENPSPH